MPDDEQVRQHREFINADTTPQNLIDDAATVAALLPAWCNEVGLPKSFLHFHYGILYAQRARARQAITMAGAVAVLHMKDENRKEWWELQRNAAGE